MLYLFWMTVPLAFWEAMTRPALAPARTLHEPKLSPRRKD
jgi:hypothetical protein